MKSSESQIQYSMKRKKSKRRLLSDPCRSIMQAEHFTDVWEKMRDGYNAFDEYWGFLT